MIIGNWKSNMLKKTLWCQDFENEFKPLGFDHKPNPQSWLNCRMGVAVPTIDVLDMQKVCDHYFGDWYKRDDVYELIFDIGVQDVDHSSGSRTGAISVDMISEYLCYFAIIGHSERRQLFNEDNDVIKKKLKTLHRFAEGGFNEITTTILCIGETKEENDKGITKDVLKDQLKIVNGLRLDGEFTVAYEPVWAIGSGLTPEPKDINEIHKYIKDVVQSNSANNLIPSVLYGGSVTDKNAESFFKEEFVDGALVGSASLDGSTFAKIVNIFNSTKKT